MATCAFHPGRETAVSCSSCGKPICPDCMTPTPVGMRCPDCSRQRTRVVNAANFDDRPVVTIALIAINVAVYLVASLSSGGLASGGRGDLMLRGETFGPAIANQGEWWRIITGGFLHAGPLHLLMNMVFIWILGSQLEPALGRARFAALYFVSLLCGSLGSLIVAPDTPVVGASGAAFGLLGAAIVMARRRRVDIWSSGLMPVLLINLVFTFTVSGIAIGGHIGGIIGGLAAGWALEEVDERSGRAASLAAAALMAVAVFGLTLVVADQTVAAQSPMFGY